MRSGVGQRAGVTALVGLVSLGLAAIALAIVQPQAGTYQGTVKLHAHQRQRLRQRQEALDDDVAAAAGLTEGGSGRS